MAGKIKNYFKNLSPTQKILYLVLVFMPFGGIGFLDAIGVSGSHEEEVWLGIVLVCIVGIFLFGDKKVK